MVPRGLIIAVVVGISSGGLFGMYFYNENYSNLEFVEGASLSIITQKDSYNVGEEVTITVINSGTTPLAFPDASYGLKITGLDGRELYTPVAAQVISVLEPRETITLSWDQTKNDGEQALEGRYKIVSSGFDPQDNVIENSVTINIVK